MRLLLRRLLIGILLCLLTVSTSGCFLRLLFGAVGERDTDFGSVFIATIGGVFGPLAICDFDETENLVNCTYSFFDFEFEEPFTITSSVQLVEEFGVLGLFVDPLILQVPVGATNFAATFDDGSGPQSIVVTEVSSFNVQPGTTVSAETGQKFIILEFPPNVIATLTASGVLNGPFNFNFELELPSLSAVAVKAMFAGKVEVNGQTFYAPLLPCTTDFASIPSFEIPVAAGNVNLLPAIFNVITQLVQAGNAGCNGQVYNFTSVPQLGPFMCYKTKSSRGNICVESSPANAGASCDEEDDCGGTPDDTAFCVPNKFPKGLQVTLTDQFETDILFDVKKPESLCNPATVNAAVNQDEDTHLKGYRTVLSRTSPRQPKPARQSDLRITNQLHPNGELVVDTIQPDRLLVPTAKSLIEPVTEPDPATHEVDHFNCYKVKVSRGDPKFPKNLQARIVDQFNQPKLYDVKKPTRLCAPVDKNGEAPGAETHPEHLMCYQVRQTRGVCASNAVANPGAACKKEEDCGGERKVTNFCEIQSKHQKVRNIFVNNQFGPEQLDTLREDELCIPSTKTRP